jgi:hypothetical protein
MQCEPGAEKFALVHGRVCQLKGGHADPDLVIGHAWIETEDGTIYDPVLDQYTRWGEYAAERGAVIERRYTHAEAMETLLKFRHFGPWHND